MRRMSRVFILSIGVFLHFYADAQQNNLPDASAPDGVANVKSWARRRLVEAEQSFRESGSLREPSPGFWGDKIIYQIQVDRFNNGDLANDRVNIPAFQQATQDNTQKGLADYRHGGDLQGIIDRLDYLRELGVGALWITPIFTNANGSYHNYCTSDFTQVDPGFGTNELFRRLVREAHNRGIKVILDVVVNHICDSGTRYVAREFSDYGRCVRTQMEKYISGNPQHFVDGLKDVAFGPKFFAPFKHPDFLTRCGSNGDSGSNGAGSLFGDFSDEMFDLNTQNWDFQEIFTDLHKWWIAYADVDGFRMDAAKHITADFTAKFASEARAYAQSIGKKNFYVVGEVAGEIDFDGRRFDPPLHLGWMQGALDARAHVPPAVTARARELRPLFSTHAFWPRPGLNGIYDFSTSGTILSLWRRGASPLSFKNIFFNGPDFENSQPTGYYREISDNGDARLSWTLLEIHDWPRFGIHGESRQQMLGAMSHLLLSEGMPIIYYGFEQGLNGARPATDRIQIADGEARRQAEHILSLTDHSGTAHPRYRQDMFVGGPWRLGSTVESVQALAGVGRPLAERSPANWREDPYLRTDHELFQRIRGLSHLRQSCSALRYGKMYFRAAEEAANGGLLVFSRIDSPSGREVLVVTNSSDRNIPIRSLIIDSNLARGQQGQLWRNALNGFEQGRVQEANAEHPNALLNFENFELRAGAIAVFVRADNLTEFREDLGRVHLCRE